MSKMIKTADTNIKIDTSSIMVFEISNFSFEVDARYPWIDVYLTGGEGKEFVTSIDDDNMPTFVESEDGYEELKIYCLNWFFNNVEIIKGE